MAGTRSALGTFVTRLGRVPPSAYLLAIAVLALAACEGHKTEETYTATLYRNSGLDHSMRIHWATFDADEADRNYNINNCGMAARLLNSNLRASAADEENERDEFLGFWCEPGRFSDKGRVPMTFEAAFPTDTP